METAIKNNTEINKQVKIISSPVTERYIRRGDTGKISYNPHTKTNWILAGGVYFELNDKWVLEAL